MKVFVVLALVSALMGVINCQSCNSTSDCQHITCGQGGHIGCPTGICTCLVDPTPGACVSNCSQRSECSTCNCHHGHHDYHCIDGACKCAKIHVDIPGK